ncbi:MAG: LamG-like jellyroll fold domain-containing protein, partial [Victivallales bacterium]
MIYEYEIVDPLTKKEAFKETRLIKKIPVTAEWQSFDGILPANTSPGILARRFVLSQKGDVSIDDVRLESAAQESELKSLFYLSFDNSTDAVTAKGNVAADICGKVPLVPGKTGCGALFRNGNHLEFKAEDHFDQNEGTFALWVKPLTDFDDGKPHCLAEVPLEPYRFLDSGFSITKGMTDQIAPYMFYAVNGPAWHANSFNAEPVWIRNKWVHIAVAWSQKKGILRVYADGKLIDEVLRPFEKRPDTAGRILCVGSRMGGDAEVPSGEWDNKNGNIKRELPVDGAFGAEAVLDEVQIFNRMIDNDEAWQLAGNTGKAPDNALRPLSASHLTELPHKLITPHVPFAKPLFQSPPKALFLIPSRVARDVVELWQRMDMEYEAFLLNKSKKGCPFQLSEFVQRFCYGATKDDRFKDISDKLSHNPEVLILSDISMDKVPRTIRERILNMVNSGMGFVLINHDKHKIDYMKSKISDEAQDWLRLGIPWSGLPELLVDSTASQKKIPEKCIEAYRFGRGRVVSISFKEKTVPAEVGLTPTFYDTGYSREWDYRYTLYLSMMGRLICWASGRDSDLKLVFPPDGRCFERSTLPLNSAFNMSIQGLLPANAVLKYEINDPQGIAECEKKIILRGSNIQLALPLLKSGLHYLTMRLEVDGKTCDWGTIAFHVKAKDEIQSIVLNSDYLERGEILRGKIQLIGPATKESLITVRTIDTIGRIYSQLQLNVAENISEVSFALPINDPETIMSYIEAELYRNGNVVSTSSAQFFVPRRNMSAPEAQEFPALAWWNISPYAGCSMIHARRLRELGFNIGLFWPYEKSSRNVTAWDFTTCAYMTALRMNADKKGWTVPVVPDITDGSWANPLVKEEIWRQVKSLLGDLRKYGPFFYSLGDENRYRGEMGFSPYGIKAYHEMQGKKYGSIDKLNQEWGTGYSSFEDVPRLTPAQARAAENAPALIDHRETNEALWRGM